MKGRKPKPAVTVQRAFVPTRLSDDLLAQAYEHVLQRAQQITTSQETHATPTTRSRKRVSVATTGGRK
jgi:hypothetical protein